MYTRESVDQYRKQREIFEEKYVSSDANNTEKGGFVTLTKITTLEEMKECQDLSQEIFGVGRGTEKERMKIVEKNPDTYYLLKRGNKGIGYFSIMPLKKGNLENVLGQTLPVKISPNQIEKFEKGKQLDLYLTAIGVIDGFTTEEKHEIWIINDQEVNKFNFRSRRKGIKIETIAARSNMPDGIRLMRHAGFTEIPPLTPERRTFIIDIKSSGIPFVLKYKKYLEKSKSDQN